VSDTTGLQPLPVQATASERYAQYARIDERLYHLLQGETNAIAVMATIVCELHHAFDYFNWTGFYRNVDGELVIGPYQGTHGCLRIAFDRGVCGAAATTQQTQLVPDVHAFPGHIACSSTTQSELVVPWLASADSETRLLGVLDIDSDAPAAFTQADASAVLSILEKAARQLEA
jgi:GAF domain-containing protein